MKTITTLALLAGMIFVVPLFAHETEKGSEAKEMNIVDKGDFKHEALKKFVNEALDAHKGKAPKEMRGHQDEMKAYVERALDAQQKMEIQILGDTDDLNYQQSLQYLIDRAQPMAGKPPLHGLYINADCASLGDRTPAQLQCLANFVNNIEYDACGSLMFTFQNDCTGSHLFGAIKGSCHNPNFKAACIDLATPCGMAAGSNDLISNCQNDN